jgi:hypothetical protein
MEQADRQRSSTMFLRGSPNSTALINSFRTTSFLFDSPHGLTLTIVDGEWRCETGFAAQGEIVEDWTADRQTRAGYNQNTYKDLFPSGSWCGDPRVDFRARLKKETIQAIERLKGTLPTLTFVLNYLLNHVDGRALMEQNRAVMTLEEVGAFLLWIGMAITESDNDLIDGELRHVNPDYWFRSPTATPIFEGMPCIAARAFRLIQRAAPHPRVRRD